MLSCKKNKFWLENIPNLFCSFSVVPLEGMGLADQMNAITRLVILVFLVLLLLGFKHSGLFLLLSLLFIIILYYIQRKNMEAFQTEKYHGQYPMMKAQMEQNPRTGTQRLVMDRPSTFRFCDDQVQLDGINGAYNNPNYVSINQQLAGPPNPKTLIPPVVVAPSADLGYWKANNTVVHSAINDETNLDVYQSGYQVSTCCGSMIDKVRRPVANPLAHNVMGSCANPQSIMENYTPRAQQHQEVRENFSYPYMKTSSEKGLYICPDQPGWMNTACGYNPKQLYTAGLPTNLPAGNCPQDPVFKQYNQNLFTQTIQPGVYTRNEINEPINANMGISFTQQFEPTTCKSNPRTGEVMYTEHDPRIIEPVISEPNTAVIEAVTESNVYDPRFSGYGTSYRAYNDDNVGQTRFYYDDVDAIRMPNYITRSNIDHQPFADQYGPLPAGEACGNKFNSDIRALANNAFLDGALEFRTGLQERLMRKRNAEAWQQRAKPIRTGGQFMLGGMGSCK